MREEYIKPVVKMCTVGPESMIATSDGVTGDNGIDYGGIDNDGTRDPSAKGFDYSEDGPDAPGGWSGSVWDE